MILHGDHASRAGLPETAGVTVLVSAYAALVNKAAAVQLAASNVRSFI